MFQIYGTFNDLGRNYVNRKALVDFLVKIKTHTEVFLNLQSSFPNNSFVWEKYLTLISYVDKTLFFQVELKLCEVQGYSGKCTDILKEQLYIKQKWFLIINYNCSEIFLQIWAQFLYFIIFTNTVSLFMTPWLWILLLPLSRWVTLGKLVNL